VGTKLRNALAPIEIERRRCAAQVISRLPPSFWKAPSLRHSSTNSCAASRWIGRLDIEPHRGPLVVCGPSSSGRKGRAGRPAIPEIDADDDIGEPMSGETGKEPKMRRSNGPAEFGDGIRATGGSLGHGGDHGHLVRAG